MSATREPAVHASPELLRVIREARFGQRPRCVHCGAGKLHRWGTFAGRQRYRCAACRRTFSDLTGTPAAHIKKLGLWPRYGHCLRSGLSVRAAAGLLGIDPSTAFRWRHRLLGGRKASEKLDATPLQGWIELGVEKLVESHKGRRHLERAPRRHRMPLWERLQAPKVIVAMACDRHGQTVTGVVPWPVLRPEDLSEMLTGRLNGAPDLTAMQGRMGVFGRFARLQGLRYHHALFSESPLAHVRTLRAYQRSLRVWLTRFRGVATRYLPHYLVWHRSLDALHRPGVEPTLLRWPLPPISPESTAARRQWQ